jgi:hypothetical protein
MSKPLVDPRQITAEELKSFKIPDNVLGKQFLLSPDCDESSLCEVMGYTRKRDSVTYHVVYDDDVDGVEIPMEEEELMGMLQDGYYFPA